MQNILITTLVMGCILLSSCNKDDDVPQPTTATEEPAKPCTCKNFLLGYFEMEDCQLYLPTESPFSCQGYDLLELSWNFEMHRVTFRSTDHRFCRGKKRKKEGYSVQLKLRVRSGREGRWWLQ